MSSTNETKVQAQPGGQAESPSTKQSVLGDFSVSQIVASGLAAATSFALSSQIGLAGSIIGVVIGAVASTAASQIYRNILSSSAEKLRAFGSDDEDYTDVGAGVAAAGNAAANGDQASQREPWQPRSVSGRTQVQQVSGSGTPIAPREVRHAAHARRQALIRRRVTIVTACVGVATVLVFAFVVNMVTQGTGIRTTSTSSTQTQEETNTKQQAEPQKPDATPTDDKTTDAAPTDTTTTDDSATAGDTSGDGTSANTGADTGDTSDATNSGNGTSNGTNGTNSGDGTSNGTNGTNGTGGNGTTSGGSSSKNTNGSSTNGAKGTATTSNTAK